MNNIINAHNKIILHPINASNIHREIVVKRMCQVSTNENEGCVKSPPMRKDVSSLHQ